MSIIQNLIDILRFQAKPEDVPYNKQYTLIAFIAAWITGSLQVSLNNVIESPALFYLVDILTVTGLTCLFLIAATKKIRIPQTLLAMYGCSTLIQVILYISANLGLGIVLLVAAIWGFIVHVYIIRHALGVSKPQAFFTTVGMKLSAAFMTTLLFPEALQRMLEVLQASGAQ